MEIHDGVLTYRLLNSANLTKENMQLVKATLPEMKYSLMKDKLKKIFTSSEPNNEKANIKIEPDTLYDETISNEPSQVLYSKFKGSNNNRGNYQGNRNGGYFKSNKSKNYNKNNDRKTNPLNENGEISRCAICESIYHWANKCPAKYKNKQSSSSNEL